MSVETLVELARGRRMLALTGAGISTESGIPDYRGQGRSPRPMLQDAAFRRDPETRQRYWARSAVGYARFVKAAPHQGHRALAELEARGLLRGVITQNVDRLHHAAGSRRVIELHGALARVVCLECGAIERRNELQRRLLDLNPEFDERNAVTLPDGDAELPPEGIARFRIAGCLLCQGVLKPDVVLFGGSVSAEIVAQARSWVDEAELLLVVGSSLAVFSGYRFVRQALAREIPLVIVNLGPTRADAQASLRIEGRAGEILPELARRLLDEAQPHLPG